MKDIDLVEMVVVQMTGTRQPRRPPGTPEGGQWAPSAHDEADIPLEVPDAQGAAGGTMTTQYPTSSLSPLPDGVSQEVFDEVTNHPSDPDPYAICGATPREVDWILDNGPDVHKTLLAGRDDLSVQQYMRLLDPDLPFSARLDTVRRCYHGPGLAEKASYDPDPIIRAYALSDGWDLPRDRAEALKADPETVRMMDKLGLEPLG